MYICASCYGRIRSDLLPIFYTHFIFISESKTELPKWIRGETNEGGETKETNDVFVIKSAHVIICLSDQSAYSFNQGSKGFLTHREQSFSRNS
jgi:hypothetical protein